MRKKITHYKRFQYIYGLNSLLLALEYFEANENYLECHYILKAIRENEKDCKCEFPKRIKDSDFELLSEERQICQIQNADKLINYDNW